MSEFATAQLESEDREVVMLDPEHEDMLHARAWVTNYQRNLDAGHYMAIGAGGQHHDAIELLGAHRDCVATVIANGPSLRGNVGRVSSEGVTLVADTAARYCIDHGVKVDYVLALDPQDKLAEYLSPVDSEGIGLLVPFHISPKVIEVWRGPIYWFKQYRLERMLELNTLNIKQIDVLADQLGDAAGIQAEVLAQHNVGSTAIGIPWRLWGSPITLIVGLDLAWKPDRYSAADLDLRRPILKKRRWVRKADRDKTKSWKIRGIDGADWITCKSFEDGVTGALANMLLVEREGGKVLNCTEGGIVNYNTCSLSVAYEAARRVGVRC